MDKLKVNLQNCYGIESLEEEFDFTSRPGSSKTKAYAIYAPNGLMKSSFAKTFEDISNGNMPKEERYNRPSTCEIKINEVDIEMSNIYVLKSEIDISSDSPAITDILVNPENKARYDNLLIDIDKQKNKLIASLQKSSKVKKNDIENKILRDFNNTDFPSCIIEIKNRSSEDDLHFYDYATIFDPKALAVLNSKEFVEKADEFNTRYQEIFNNSGKIYKKGVFNPTKAETSFTTLDKQGFFAGGHRVHLDGEENSINKEELENKLKEINAVIDGDITLKKIRNRLSKNAQTQALVDLFENLQNSKIEFLLEKVTPSNQNQFRKDLWTYCIKNSPECDNYLKLFNESKDEIRLIEATAAQATPKWKDAVELFNNRFMDMPFTLSVQNQKQAALGLEQAKLLFTFKDGDDSVTWSRSEIKTLSQGEKRALYLLNFIFEVEARKKPGEISIFIIDDTLYVKIDDSQTFRKESSIYEIQYRVSEHSIEESITTRKQINCRS